MKGAGASMEDMKKVASNAGTTIEQALDKGAESADKVKKKGEENVVTWGSVIGKVKELAVAFVALKTVGESLSFANDISAGVGKLQAQLGITEAEAQKFGAVGKEVFLAGWGDSIDEVTGDMGKLHQNIQNVSDATAKDILTSAETIKKAFGVEVDESTRTSSVLMKNFGIDGQHALDLITVGMQKGGDFSGELLDTMREYSPQFKAMGFSADGMLNTLIKGAQSGAFNLDKVGDAVKEFNLRAKDGSVTTAQGFQMIGLDANKMGEAIAKGGDSAQQAYNATIMALANMKDPVQQNIAGVNLFGTQWEDLSKNVVLAMSSGTNALGTIDGATKKAGDALQNNTGAKLEKLKRSFLDAGGTIAMPLIDGLNSVLPKVIEFIGKIKDAFSKGGLRGVLEMVFPKDIADSIANIISAITNAIGTFVNFLSANSDTITSIMGAILDVISGLYTFVSNNFSTIIALVAGVVGAFIAFQTISFVAGVMTAISTAGGILAAVMGVLTPVTAAFGAVLAFITSPIGIIVIAIGALIAVGILLWKNWSSVSNFLMGIWQSISDFAMSVFSAIGTFFTNIFTGISTFIQTVWQGIVDGFNAFVAIFQPIFQAIWTVISTIFITTFETIKAYLLAVWEFIKIIFGTALGIIVAIFTGQWDKIGAILRTAGQMIMNVITNLWETVKGLFSGALSVISNAVSGALTYVRNLFSSAVSAVIGTVSNMVSSVGNFFSNLWSSITNTVSNMWTGIKNFFINGVNDAKTTVSNFVESVVGFFTGLPGRITQFGKDLITGFLDGVKSMGTWLKDKIVAFIDDHIPGPIKSLLGINSPSKLFRQFGQWTMQGYSIGVEKEGSNVKKSVEDVFSNLPDGKQFDVGFNTESFNNAIAQANKAQASIASSYAMQNNVNVRVYMDSDDVTDKVELKMAGKVNNVLGGRLF
jgi:phage-related minor tail protein